MSKRAAFPLDAQRTSPSIARGHTARLLDPLVRAEYSDDAQLVVSELVTNAVIHATEPITLRLTLEGEMLRIEVFDSGPAIGAVAADPPTRRATSPGGRGLQIVEALAVSCGVERHPAGMTVWAVVRIRPAAAGRGQGPAKLTVAPRSNDGS